MELKDIVYIDFKDNSNHAMLISEFTEVFEFKDNKPTKKCSWFIKRVCYFKGRIYVSVHRLSLTEYQAPELMHKYSAWYDEESQVFILAEQIWIAV